MKREMAKIFMALTVVDPLGYLDERPVCTGYEIDGHEVHSFGIGIIGTGFAPRTRIFVKRDTAAEICGIFALKRAVVDRVEACTYIKRKHAR